MLAALNTTRETITESYSGATQLLEVMERSTKGLWKNDYRVKGWVRLQDGTEYDGEWMNDVMHGHGRLTFKANGIEDIGIIYEGRTDQGTKQT